MVLDFINDLWSDFTSNLQNRDQGIDVFRLFIIILSDIIDRLLKHSDLPNSLSIILFLDFQSDILTHYVEQLDRRLLPRNTRNVQLHRREQVPLDYPAPNYRLFSDIQMTMFYFQKHALDELEHPNQRNLNNHFGFIRNIHLWSDPNKLHNFLEAKGVRSEWIPREYTCPITLTMIDGTPVYAQNSPERFNRNALLTWLNKKNTHPMTREALSADELKYDPLMEGKIKIFSHWVLFKKAYLETLSFKDALAYVNQFKKQLDRSFALTYEPAMYRFAEQLLSKLRTSAMLVELDRSLVIAKKEVKAFSTMDTKILFFQRLGLSIDANTKQIEQAYHKLARPVHPDKNSDSEAKDQFFKLTEARNYLLNKDNISSSAFALECNLSS